MKSQWLEFLAPGSQAAARALTYARRVQRIEDNKSKSNHQLSAALTHVKILQSDLIRKYDFMSRRIAQLQDEIVAREKAVRASYAADLEDLRKLRRAAGARP